jgi:hypothetical protein
MLANLSTAIDRMFSPLGRDIQRGGWSTGSSFFFAGNSTSSNFRADEIEDASGYEKRPMMIPQ